MSATYIPISEENKKLILNFIGMCRLSGLENGGEPSFTFRDNREGVGVVMFDLFYRSTGIEEPCWNMTVKVDASTRFHDEEPDKPGETYCYLDAYKIAKDSLELEHKTSKFNIFAF
ncbi:MAG: hypothetical protein Q4D60_03300 [Eubacteriales bacterium]|nr:hypothetical protein [Eubacteriales bacterium]